MRSHDPFWVVLATLTLWLPLHAGSGPADKSSRIMVLLAVSGASSPEVREAAIQVARDFFAQRMAETPLPVPPNVQDRAKFFSDVRRAADQALSQEFTEQWPDYLRSLVVPIYDKHFTEKEIDDLIRFYRSPIGSKLARALPQMFVESSRAAARWAEQRTEKVLDRMLKSLKLMGYD